MRMRLWIGLLAAAFAALPASAQETHGNINGVVEDAGGVVPGAGVRITNADTGQTQQLVTSDRGYFEAVLLNPGTYAVRVELQGFKTLTRTGISLAVGQTVSLTLTLEVACTLKTRAGENLFTDRIVQVQRDAFTDRGQLQSEYQSVPLLAEALAKKVAHAVLDVW